MIEVLVVLGLIGIGFSYYILFKEHHKKNGMRFDEIYPLIIEYAVISIISIFLLIVGVQCIIEGCVNNDEIYEVIQEFTVGIVIISLTLIHFIFWIKTHRVDYEKSDRDEKEEKTTNIAEWIELIAFVLMIIGSVLNIIKYVQFIDETVKVQQIVISILCIIVSSFLLWKLNPLNIFKKS